MMDEMRLIQNNMQVIEELHHLIIDLTMRIDSIEERLKKLEEE